MASHSQAATEPRHTSISAKAYPLRLAQAYGLRLNPAMAP